MLLSLSYESHWEILPCYHTYGYVCVYGKHMAALRPIVAHQCIHDKHLPWKKVYLSLDPGLSSQFPCESVVPSLISRSAICDSVLWGNSHLGALQEIYSRSNMRRYARLIRKCPWGNEIASRDDQWTIKRQKSIYSNISLAFKKMMVGYTVKDWFFSDNCKITSGCIH